MAATIGISAMIRAVRASVRRQRFPTRGNAAAIGGATLRCPGAIGHGPSVRFDTKTPED